MASSISYAIQALNIYTDRQLPGESRLSIVYVKSVVLFIILSLVYRDLPITGLMPEQQTQLQQ
jgi:hypothetical protein